MSLFENTCWTLNASDVANPKLGERTEILEKSKLVLKLSPIIISPLSNDSYNNWHPLVNWVVPPKSLKSAIVSSAPIKKDNDVTNISAFSSDLIKNSCVVV